MEHSADIRLEALELSDRVKQILDQVIAIIRCHLDDRKGFELYLFGSRARDAGGDRADIDLAVSCEDLSEEAYRKIRREIADLRTLVSVDLLHLQRVDPAFKELILSTGLKIYG